MVILLKFSLLRTVLSEFILHTYHRAYLHHVTSGDVRKQAVTRRIFGIHRRTVETFVDATSSEP